MSNYYYFKPDLEKDCSSFSLLEGVADNPQLTKFVIKTMSTIFNYELNPEQKALVTQSIQRVAENNQEITMLDCFEEGNKYPILDNWNAYIQKYFLF